MKPGGSFSLLSTQPRSATKAMTRLQATYFFFLVAFFLAAFFGAAFFFAAFFLATFTPP